MTILDTIKTQEQHQSIDEQQVKHQVKHEDKHQVELSSTQYEILKTLKTRSLSRKEIFAAIGKSGDTRSFNRNIAPLLSGGLIEMTIPDKPNRRLQKYRLTDEGKATIIKT